MRVSVFVGGFDLDAVGPLGCGLQTGAVGLSVIMAAQVIGATTIISLDVLQPRLDLALEPGAPHAINGKDTDVVDQVKALTAGLGVDHAVDTTADPHVLMNAVNGTRYGGSTGLIGVSKPDAVPQVFVPQMIEMSEAGRFPFEELITKPAFSAIEQPIEDTRTGAAVKAVLVMHD
jgi:aryl-alcohol dehydrogenase